MINMIKRLFCKHEWKPSVFQRITNDSTVTYHCKKCGKYFQFNKSDWKTSNKQ